MSSSKRHFGKQNEALFSGAVGSFSSRQVPLQFRWCANSSKFPLACHAIDYHYESTFLVMKSGCGYSVSSPVMEIVSF